MNVVNLSGANLVVDGNIYALRLVGRFNPKNLNPATVIDKIKTEVCQEFCVQERELMSPTRTERLANARFYAFRLARDVGMTVQEIGHHFNRDHGSVINGLKRLESLSTVEPEINVRLAILRQKLNITPKY